MSTLWLVATPIGNLGDLPPRAVEALANAALVCCEDTRRTGRLLAESRPPEDHEELRARGEIFIRQMKT